MYYVCWPACTVGIPVKMPRRLSVFTTQRGAEISVVSAMHLILQSHRQCRAQLFPNDSAQNRKAEIMQLYIHIWAIGPQGKIT